MLKPLERQSSRDEKTGPEDIRGSDYNIDGDLETDCTWDYISTEGRNERDTS
jgi:hypothetical protein